MGKGLFIFIMLVLIIAGSAIVGLVFLFSGDPELSTVQLEDCNVLAKTNNDATNIVFFGDSIEEAKDYTKYFLGFSPIDENQERFNFYYIGGYKPECELYKDVAILCYSRDLVKKASSCPNDHIIVLDGDRDRSIRSSNYLNVMSINTKHPKTVLMHEFGHSFVNLAEEYVPAKIPRNSGGNCVEKCDDYTRETDGCYTGCSLADYIRSVDNGIMRTLRSEYYGLYNEGVIREKIDNIEKGFGTFGFDPSEAPRGAPTGFAIKGERDCSNEEYYLIEGNVDLNTLKRSIEKGCFGDSGSGGFRYDVVLQDKSEVFVGEFNPEEIFTSAPGEDEIDGAVYVSDKDFFLKAPIIGGAEILEVKDDIGDVVVSVPICEDLRGDANGDGNIDIRDVNHINKHIIEGSVLACPKNADFDGDGQISNRDIDDLGAVIVEGKDVSNSPQEDVNKEAENGDSNLSGEKSSVCGDGVVEEGEICDGNIQICGIDSVRECLSDCSGYNESCVSLGSGNVQELYIENCDSVNDWNVTNGTWIGFNSECLTKKSGMMESVGINVSDVTNVSLSFTYTSILRVGEFFDVFVNEVSVFRVDEVNKTGNAKVELDVNRTVKIRGECGVGVNSSGSCKWDDIRVSGISKVEKLGFFGRITGFLGRVFG